MFLFTSESIQGHTGEFDSGDDCVIYVNGYNATLKQALKTTMAASSSAREDHEYSSHTYPVEDVMGGFLNVAGVVVGLKGKSNNNGGKEHD